MPTKQETRFLILAESYIDDPIHDQGLFPENKWFEDKLGISKSGVSNLKTSLIRKEYLEIKDGQTVFAKKAREFLNSLSEQGDPSVLYVLTPGAVSAGRASGELSVFANEVDDTLTDSIAIPAIQFQVGNDKSYSKIVAYRVIGDSMEREGIIEGDYVLVETNPQKALLENRLIVTKYLLKGESLDRDELRGPTLKFYKGKEGKYAILTTSKQIFDRPYLYEIEASYLDPVGIVIGVYREIKR